MNQTNDRQKAVLAALSGGGIDAKDISTTQVSLQPQYGDTNLPSRGTGPATRSR